MTGGARMTMNVAFVRNVKNGQKTSSFKDIGRGDGPTESRHARVARARKAANMRSPMRLTNQ